ncbi:Hsp70 family protein [Nodularia sphaerocarpa]|uniref:Hsp70 family protein n=1 Tax=Nodularia sphaerocarpa TaxID=137816 RepID=UPI001EFA5A53|nr:Hsp70 family protein [Nodularia sphaerocarpa]MDB9373905.1 Hsp70 family protein [Nodularia sphaerocarpa CS-585]MDB9376269.1 Hsp70 family protein [Nodularia sphaerocarpa CS-585A2]ULP72203.1 Chaperone protein DnaK [Nodularia sphaerocarpa UHCC 0038]
MTTVAIDFGTSNTVVSILESDTQLPKTLRFPNLSSLFVGVSAEGDRLEIPVIPTLLYIKSGHQVILGAGVRSQRLGLSQSYPPERLFKKFKRDLAGDYQPPARHIEGINYDSVSVAELFIHRIWTEIKKQNIHPSHLIFTVPVGAFERYLDWFRSLGEKLNVPQVSVIDESTAAALGYAVKRPGALILVVDFGGGTLDLSLVRTVANASANLRAEVLAKSEAYTGGEDIDVWIVEDYLRSQNFTPEQVGKISYQNLLEIAERLKIKLSKNQSVSESWFDDESFMSYELKITREKLEEILEYRQFLQELRDALDEVLGFALRKGFAKNDIEQVLLVGGSCLIPAVQQLIISYFGKSKVKLNKPFDAVCHGALAVQQITEIDDFLRHSYAIRLWESYSKTYTYHCLFAQGTKYPCESDEWLTLQVANHGQREIRLDIGELGDMAQTEIAFDASGRMTSSTLQHQESYRSLDVQHQQVCVAKLNPPGEAGFDRISVLFYVDSRRFLLATVKDLLTGAILLDRGEVYKLR